MESVGPTCSNTGNIGIAQLMFTQLIAALTSSFCDLNPTFPQDQSQRVISRDEKYDFIVVGSGSAGSTIAARLSEVSHWNILLIEAGPDPPLESNIPALLLTLFGSSYDWNFITEPSETACGIFKNKQCIWPKGKMMGGTSSMNGMYYIRGLAQDYDNWGKEGNDGWGYEDVLKYFKKLETVRAKHSIEEVHGYKGDVNVEEFSDATLSKFNEFEKRIKDAALELGLPEQPDFAATMKSGSISLWGTVKNGTRASSAISYLVPAKDRENLIIMKETLVTKLLIDDQNLVYGVQVLKNGEFHNITCTKEVILSAGAINSPKIMMLSGIGPKEHLNELGIPVIADLKVGYNLQDHVLLRNYFIKMNVEDPPPGQYDALYNYLTKRTDLGSAQAVLIFKDTLNENVDYPDIQYQMNYQVLLSIQTELNKLGLSESFIEWIQNIDQQRDIASIMPTLLRPKSVGRVLLRSTNVTDPPKLINGHLEDEDDVKTMIRAIKFMDMLMETNALKNATLLVAPAEECNQYEAYSDELYKCYMRNFGLSVYHVAGSCKMGPTTDPNAVVDPRLRVYQMIGLRVADSSIMPKIVSGNTNVPTIMIGEKAADMIKEDYL